MGDFNNFINSIRPPADGRYLWKVAALNHTAFAVSMTAVVVGGEYDGRRFSTQFRVEDHADSIERLLVAIDGYVAKSERELSGRTFFATKKTGRRGTPYLTAISAEEDDGQDGAAPDEDGASDDDSAAE